MGHSWAGRAAIDRGAAGWHPAPEMEAACRMVNARCTLRLLLAAAPLALGGCGVPVVGPFFDAPTVQRGNRVTEDQLREITPGVQTRADVQTLLGSPTARSTFDEASWYYISADTRQRPGRSLSVTQQQVVAVDFDARGTVRTIRRLGESDGQRVSFVERETPVPGNERTLLQALFGNIGRIGPGAVQPNAGGPGSIGPGTISPGAGSGR